MWVDWELIGLFVGLIFDSCFVARAADEISGGGFIMTFYELLGHSLKRIWIES